MRKLYLNVNVYNICTNSNINVIRAIGVVVAVNYKRWLRKATTLIEQTKNK